MQYLPPLAVGLLIGLLGMYVWYHRQNIDYTLTTIKEDIHNLTVKVENLLRQ